MRSTIPTTTVDNQTISPVGASALGLRQPRLSSHPIAVPVRNGHAVSATPLGVRPSAWLRRPTAQNVTTAAASRAIAVCVSEVIV